MIVTQKRKFGLILNFVQIAEKVKLTLEKPDKVVAGSQHLTEDAFQMSGRSDINTEDFPTISPAEDTQSEPSPFKYDPKHLIDGRFEESKDFMKPIHSDQNTLIDSDIENPYIHFSSLQTISLTDGTDKPAHESFGTDFDSSTYLGEPVVLDSWMAKLDLVIIVGDKNFHCHKQVLQTNSKFFQEKLGTKNNSQGSYRVSFMEIFTRL